MTSAIGLLATCVLAWALTGLLRRYALRREILDYPGARSSHSVPTPRGGGVAIVGVFVGATLVLALARTLEFETAAATGGCGLIVAAIGFWDDHGHVSARWRLLVQSLAALAGLYLLGALPTLPLGDRQVELGVVGGILALVATVWLVNLYNFMDGIDGIAAAEAVTVSAGAAVILWVGFESALALWCLLLGMASAGFLIWNWPPARIFMGDSGSGFLGFVLALLAVITSQSGAINIWSWLILLGVFVVDATVTLCRRVLRGERWWEAHRGHAYQWAARRWGSHKRVTVAVACINVVLLFPVAWLAAARPQSAAVLFLAVYTVLAGLALAIGAGRPENGIQVPASHA